MKNNRGQVRSLHQDADALMLVNGLPSISRRAVRFLSDCTAPERARIMTSRPRMCQGRNEKAGARASAFSSDRMHRLRSLARLRNTRLRIPRLGLKSSFGCHWVELRMRRSLVDCRCNLSGEVVAKRKMVIRLATGFVARGISPATTYSVPARRSGVKYA